MRSQTKCQILLWLELRSILVYARSQEGLWYALENPPTGLCSSLFKGFTISLPEYIETIESLWETTKGQFCPFMTLQVKLSSQFQNLFESTLNIFLKTMLWVSCPTMEGTHTTDATVSTWNRTERVPLHDNTVSDWSNFEIGDLRFWRGEAYMKYFEHLDAAGGFYYEVSC